MKRSNGPSVIQPASHADRNSPDRSAMRLVFRVIPALMIMLAVGAGTAAASQAGVRGIRHTNTLTIGTDVPYAAIYIDGRYTGMAPLSVQLPSGRYAVTVDARGHREYNQLVDLSQDLRIDARFSRLPSRPLRSMSGSTVRKFR